MQIETIPLAQLHAHPDNSNVMPEPMLEKLASHIERSERYPPIIVRPLQSGDEAHASDDHTYQILDGHHRVEALRRLGRDTAHCVIWHVDDAQALLLMATLNRLEGEDDARKRAALVSKLAARHELDELADQLPEQREALEKLLSLDRPLPAPRPPQPIDQMPQAVHFFLLPAQRRQLEARLQQIGGPREAALMQLVECGASNEPQMNTDKTDECL